MSELVELRDVAAKAMALVQHWSDGEAARAHRVRELGASLRSLETAEVAAGTWEETHGA